MAITRNASITGSIVVAGFSLCGIGLVVMGCGKAPSLASSTNTSDNAPLLSLASDNPGPVRMARISYETGKVSWRPDSSTEWAAAPLNMPVRQGAELWLAPGSRLELQFDDGSTLRLGAGAVATLQTLYSDNQGEFTEVKLAAGDSSWHLKNKNSIYQIDAPCDSVKAAGPSDFRVDVKPKADSLAVHTGTPTILAGGREKPVTPGHSVLLASQNDPIVEQSEAPNDDWDNFNHNRDAVLDEAPAHVPPDIALVSGGLDRHGHWHNVDGTGWVWTPTEEVGWRPYHHGHWAWVDPYGWTWVSSDPWGWAPYHYGTWARFNFGWGWAPGPAVQYWSPARVDFVDSDGYVTWAPLAPEEVAYPAFSVGFGGDNWAVNFSIGAACVYEPFGSGICQPVAYPWDYYRGGSRHDGWDPHGWGQNQFAFNTNNFVPRNAAFGAVRVSDRAFGGGGQFEAMNRDATPAFRNGRQAVANREAFSGPVNIHPSNGSFASGRGMFASAGPAAFNRTLVRAQLPANVQRGVGGMGSRTANRVSAPAAAVAARQALGMGGRNVVTNGGRNVVRTPTTAGRANAARANGVARNNTAGRVTAAGTSGRRNAGATATTGARRTAATRGTTRGRTASSNTNRTRRNTGSTGRATGGNGRATAGNKGRATGGTGRATGGTNGRATGGSNGRTNRGTGRANGGTNGRTTGGSNGRTNRGTGRATGGTNGRATGGKGGAGNGRATGGTKGGGGNDKDKKRGGG